MMHAALLVVALVLTGQSRASTTTADLRLDRSRPIVYLVFNKRLPDERAAIFSRVQATICNNSRVSIGISAASADQVCEGCVTVPVESRVAARIRDCSTTDNFTHYKELKPGTSLTFVAAETCLASGASLLVPFEFLPRDDPPDAGPEMKLVLWPGAISNPKTGCGE